MADDEKTDWIEFLKQGRDELRVKMHLASMEAKERFADLDRDLEKLDNTYRPKANAAAGVVDETGREIIKDLKAGFQKLREHLNDEKEAPSRPSAG